MPAPASLYDAVKRATAHTLRDAECRHGTASVGVGIEAALDAIREFLRERQGPEAAFNVLSRQADRAAEPVLAAAPIRPHPANPGE
ncbi:hypothetical protein NS228_05945 [Methylobacterium indicum]|uniref:hypothetical protein n=1 Tax=Methylobacterium indicum TaxID=1775910 RepID=UPI00073475B3|nr:hypothetical protein [Methylobacterium indicum]KTS30904.1 hypothetical protein NS229_14890 [Methylobacterium indicum]KTS41509.1 hypothetical protein NS228_05945 [Methylobacterium indicum]KTS52437.1 hypothetical protein NS230_09970 [Methylobacterium indicum]